MAFRVIEKRDDGTTIAILDNNPGNLQQNDSVSTKKTTSKNNKSNNFHSVSNNKYLAKKENEKKYLIVKPNPKGIKSNSPPENQSNNKILKTLPSEQIVNKPSLSSINQATKVPNTIQTKQPLNKSNNLPSIKKTNITPTTDLNKTQTDQEIKKPKVIQTTIETKKTKSDEDIADLNTTQTDSKLNTTIYSCSIQRNVTPRVGLYRSYSYKQRKLLPPRLLNQDNKITLVLDLDETLVHSIFSPVSHCDFSFMTDPIHYISVCLRPGVKEFILQVGDLYELVLFTVGNRVYADKIIDFIDPQHMIKYRLYRESCTYSNGNFIKDLSRLGRDLNKVIIVDDSPLTYKLQPENALPISSWINDPNDDELLKIQSFLLQNHNVDNVYNVLNDYRAKNFPRNGGRKRHNVRRKKINKI